MLANFAISALVNLLLLAGVPFLIYFTWQKWRRQRSFREIAQRAGLQLGLRRYLGYCFVFALIAVAILVIWPPPPDAFVREGSAQRAFAGLGLGGPAIPMALLYGVVKTGFTEELLFRGLIGGSLARRFSVLWANLAQAAIFLIPHLFVLRIMPELWGMLPVIFAASLFVGWVRIRSGSIVGPWLVHASVNIATCLNVAVRTAT